MEGKEKKEPQRVLFFNPRLFRELLFLRFTVFLRTRDNIHSFVTILLISYTYTYLLCLLSLINLMYWRCHYTSRYVNVNSFREGGFFAPFSLVVNSFAYEATRLGRGQSKAALEREWLIHRVVGSGIKTPSYKRCPKGSGTASLHLSGNQVYLRIRALAAIYVYMRIEILWRD